MSGWRGTICATSNDVCRRGNSAGLAGMVSKRVAQSAAPANLHAPETELCPPAASWSASWALMGTE